MATNRSDKEAAAEAILRSGRRDGDREAEGGGRREQVKTPEQWADEIKFPSGCIWTHEAEASARKQIADVVRQAIQPTQEAAVGGIADDFTTISNAMDRHDREGHEALQRIKARHQELLDAAMRVTDLANTQRVRENDYNTARDEASREERPCYAFLKFLLAKDLRDALGPAYMGGPIL